MKEKLKKFNSFAASLLPHEIRYLLSIQRFQDEEKQVILQKVSDNVLASNDDHNYDTSVDKRKYSYIQRWIKNELDKIDVDNKYLWISRMLQDILLDRISSEDEATIVKSLSAFSNKSYYFTKHYEMLIEFRQYLLIRKRYSEYKKVDSFVSDYTYDYQRSMLINQQMDQATKEIMGLENKSIVDKERWEKWLRDTFRNEHLDGSNRYLAFVRLSFYYLNRNQLNKLEDTYNSVQSFFENGQYYSRRLLLNFYDNSLVLYDRKKDYDTAIYYGKLSIKGDGPDQLLYFNNFINILLKQDKYDEALSWINYKSYKISNYKDSYSVIGYVSNYVRCLSKTNYVQHALNKAKVFWDNNKAEIMEYRWHRFLSAYIEALLINEDFQKIIKLVKRYKLIPLEQKGIKNGQPISRTIEAMYILASYYEGEIPRSEVVSKLKEFQLYDPIIFLNR